MAVVLSVLMVCSSAGVTIAYCTHSHTVSIDGLSECDDHCSDSNCGCLELTTLRLSDYDYAHPTNPEFSLPQFIIVTHNYPTFADALSVGSRKNSFGCLRTRPPREDVSQPMLCRFLI